MPGERKTVRTNHILPVRSILAMALAGLTSVLAGCPDSGGLWPRRIAQTDDTEANAVKVTPDGGFVIAGTFPRTLYKSVAISDHKGYLLKTDAAGKTLWANVYREKDSTHFLAVEPHPDGGYLFAGNEVQDSGLSGTMLLVRTGEDGNVLWARTYPEDAPGSLTAMVATGEDGFISVGLAWDRDFGSQLFTLKTNSAGDKEWSTLRDTGVSCTSARPTPDGGVILAGTARGSLMGLVKLDATGTMEWTRAYGAISTGGGGQLSVEVAADGGFLVLGTQFDIVENGSINQHMYLVKTDSNGHEEWAKTYRDFANTGSTAICVTLDGGYILGGWTFADLLFGIDADAYVVKISESGSVEWEARVGLPGADEHVRAIDVLPGGGYIVAGTTRLDGGLFGDSKLDVLLFKLKANGQLAN